MKALAACVLAAAGSVASAQTLQVQFSLRFVEVFAGTNTPVPLPDGVLQAGEAARLELTVSFSPPVGTQVPYTPPPPPGVGAVAGFGFVCFSVQGLAPNAQGSWSFQSFAPGWPFASSTYQTPTSIEGVMVGQFPLQGQTANSTNPIDPVWRAVWTPAHYQPRTAIFASTTVSTLCEGGAARILLQYGSEPGTGHPYYIPVPAMSYLWSSVQIPIEGGCYPNCDNSSIAPILNVSDFICFINSFAAQSPYANCDGSTAWPYLSVADFTCFTNRYAVGCP
jgi:hypothetical protein